MIYLIITACLLPKYGAPQAILEREARYRYAITTTLGFLPSTGEIHPVIVENNGPRPTLLDQFTWTCCGEERSVPVIYTCNNQKQYRNKGVNELMDIQQVIQQQKILPSDLVIKLTGRYAVTSRLFFETLLAHPQPHGFLRFYNVHTSREDPYDCVLGLYAIRSLYLSLLYPHTLDLYESAEKGFASYVRRTVPLIYEMKELGLECQFADHPHGPLQYV